MVLGRAYPAIIIYSHGFAISLRALTAAYIYGIFHGFGELLY